MTTTPKPKTATTSSATATTAPKKTTTAHTKSSTTQAKPKPSKAEAIMTQTVGQLEELLEHATPEELAEFGEALKEYLPTTQVISQVRTDKSRDTQLSDNWREGGYPYKHRLN